MKGFYSNTSIQLTVDTEDKHVLGYWLSILGFATVVFIGLFYSFVNLDPQLAFWTLIGGFLVFLLGAELALNNQKHHEP